MSARECGHALSLDVLCVLPAGHPGEHTDDGAPLDGGVSDPAATSGGPPLFPQYRTLPIAACGECLGDCIYEGAAGWWCPSCKHMWTAEQVAYFEDGERADD